MHGLNPGFCQWLSIGLWLTVFTGCVNSRNYQIAADDFPGHSGLSRPTGPLNGQLTLSMAIERALAANAELEVLKSAVDVAIQRKKAAGDFEDPEFRVSYTGGDRDVASRSWDSYNGLPYEILTNTVSASSGYSAGIRFIIPHPWIRAARVSAEAAGVNAVRMDVHAAQWRVSIEVCRLFTDVYYLDRDIEIIDRLVALYDENIKLFKNREQARQASTPEVMSVSQKYIQALSNRDRVLRKLAAARMKLASLTGVSVEDLISVEQGNGLSTLDLKKLTLEQLEQKALVNRADLSALYWRRLAAQEACREARAARIPWFSFVQFSYANSERDEDASDTTGGLMPAGSDSGYERSDSSIWRVDTAITIPVFSWANSTPELRNAEYRQADVILAQKVRSIYQAFQDALGLMRSLGERQARYDAESEPVISDMKKMLESMNNETGMSPDQIIKAREQIFELQRLKLEQDYEFRLGVIALEEALGVWLVPVETR